MLGAAVSDARLQMFVQSVVFGQKSEILRNLLQIFMHYVSEQFETAPT
jgi:hypothetical protein